MNRETHHNLLFPSGAFCQMCLPAHPMSAVGSERDASWHAGHAPSLSIHYKTPSRQIKYAKANHQVHGQQHTSQCVISILRVLPNLPKTSRSIGWCWAQKGCILQRWSWPKLANPLPCTHTANQMCQHQSSAPWKEAHTTMHHFYLVRFY